MTISDNVPPVDGQTSKDISNSDINDLKIYVGNLPFKFSEQQIVDLFDRFGDVVGVNLRKDRATGRPRGFGFVTFKNAKSATDAINTMNGVKVDGRILTVNTSVKRGVASKEKETQSVADDAWVTAPPPRRNTTFSRYKKHKYNDNKNRGYTRDTRNKGDRQRKNWDTWAKPTASK